MSGASSPQRSSYDVELARAGSGSRTINMPAASEAEIAVCHAGSLLSPASDSVHPAQKSEGIPARKGSQNCETPDPTGNMPFTAPELSVFQVRSSPVGDCAMQSVKVPPTSIQNCHRM